MAIDDKPVEGEVHHEAPYAGPGISSRIKVILAVLGILVIAEIYSISRISAMGKSFRAQDAQMRKELTAQFNNQISAQMVAIEHSNQQQLEVLKAELDQASRHLGAQRGELQRARAMVAAMQTQHAKQISDLQHQIALKADQQQLGALTSDVSNNKTNLDKTNKNVKQLVESFGMSRSRFGTLIARNHQEIAALNKLGKRDYYEFTLVRHHPIRLADVSLKLKKTNKKHHRFTVDLLLDDVWVRKGHRTIDEPIFFSTQGSHSFCELVVNRVDKNVIYGYISTPKGLARMASRMEGPQH